MLWVPAVSAAVEHAAVRVLPEPVSATAPQPVIETPPSVKLTAPLGLKPVTVAVNVTFEPVFEGLAELETEVEDVALFTVWVSVTLVDVPFDASPLYTALTPWLPVPRAEVAQEAVRLFPEPASVAA